MNEFNLPIHIGNNIELLITDLSSEAYGVGRFKNLAVFVDGALPGEAVEAKISGIKKNYLTAKLINIIHPSVNRQKPFCPVFEKCGGCTLQHMTYGFQLDYKKKKIKDAIERISGLKDVLVDNVIGAKEDRGYRNKVQFFFDYGNDEVKCGFFGRNSHVVINNENCFLVNSAINKLKNEFTDFIRKNKPGFYKVGENTSIIKSIIIRQSFNTKELMLIIIVSHELNKKIQALFSIMIENLIKKIPDLKSVYYSVNTAPESFNADNEIVHLSGTKSITEIISGLKFNISPGSFFQINSLQAGNLYDKIIELADLKAGETVLDLFCGTGTISLFLAFNGAKISGIDIVKSAVEDAKENAKINIIKNVKFIEGDVFRYLDSARINKTDIIVVDPPREGLAEKLISLISKLNSGKIIYVSCNAATLARDLKIFNTFGCNTRAIHPIDMFPHTEHVECVVLLERR